MKFVTRSRRGIDTYLVDGKEVSQEEYDRLFAEEKAALPKIKPARMVGKRGHGWPMKSTALGVNPVQRKAAMAQADALGVPTHFDSEGRAELRDRAHRNKLVRALGYHDRDGGYAETK